MKILVTGAAGFIGYHLIRRLIERGDTVIGLDNINDYYDIRIKYGRLESTGIQMGEISYGNFCQSKIHDNYRFIRLDLTDNEKLNKLFENEKFDSVCNLAAQAGVRYSISNPSSYVQSNLVGFMNILEACKNSGVSNLAYASSSSVYGLNESLPFSTSDNVDHPVSLYAATKKSNELMAHAYSHLYRLPTTGLRFFTVYGPWGRPDMALFLFTKAINEGKAIDVFNNGEMQRDFTYVDDIVTGIVHVLDNPPEANSEWSGTTPDPSCSEGPYKIFNIGNNAPVKLMDFIKPENKLGRKADINYMPMQPGDVPATWADTSGLMTEFNYNPSTSIEEGVGNFIDWYLEFYNKD